MCALSCATKEKIGKSFAFNQIWKSVHMFMFIDRWIIWRRLLKRLRLRFIKWWNVWSVDLILVLIPILLLLCLYSFYVSQLFFAQLYLIVLCMQTNGFITANLWLKAIHVIRQSKYICVCVRTRNVHHQKMYVHSCCLRSVNETFHKLISLKSFTFWVFLRSKLFAFSVSHAKRTKTSIYFT